MARHGLTLLRPEKRAKGRHFISHVNQTNGPKLMDFRLVGSACPVNV